jgi:hypothetical protein
MPTLADIRTQYPQYQDLSDTDLADGLYDKFYADMPRADFDQRIGFSSPASRPAPVNALRSAEFASRGVTDRAAELIGAPIDAFWKGLSYVGGPSFSQPAGERIKSGINAVGRTLSAPLNAVLPGDLGPDQPQDTTEKAAYGAGRGAVDAASVLLPAAAASRLAPAGGLVSRVGEAMAAQPGTQVLAGAVGGGTTAATDNPWYGLLAALATPLGIGAARRVVTPVGNQLNAEQQRLAAVAGTEKIPLSAAQETGSRALRSLESVFGTLPLTSRVAKEGADAQNAAFTSAALARAGIRGEAATPEVLDQHRQWLGREFERLAAATTVRYDPQFTSDVMGTIRRYANRLDAQRRPVFESFANDIAHYGGQMPGSVYQTVRSDLGTIAQNVAGSDPTLAQALRGLRTALDAAAERSMPANLKGDWTDTRRMYSALRVIERAMSGTTNAAASGQIPPTAFAQAVRAQYPRAYGFGAGEMNDLSRVGRLFVRDPVPNSGTPERLFWQNLLTGGPISAGLGSTALGADPATAVLAAGGGLVAPRLTQMLYNSPPVQAWLRNQLLEGGPEYTRGLTSAVGAAQGLDQRR